MNWKIIHIDETDSTNQWLKDHCDGVPDALVVVADYQTAGRGCGTNTWESERGKNLLFSLLIHPSDIAANEQFRITESVSVALCQTLQAYINNRVEIKWPNDIYVGDKKICGILIENRLQGNYQGKYHWYWIECQSNGVQKRRAQSRFHTTVNRQRN